MVSPMNRAFALLILFVIIALAGSARSAELAYSFRTTAGGGVALLSVDDASGAVRSHQVLFQDARCALAKKVRYSTDGCRGGGCRAGAALRAASVRGFDLERS
jgi:hypothetical protein